MAERFPISISSPIDVVEKEIDETFDALTNALSKRRQTVLAQIKEKHQHMIEKQNSRKVKSDQLKALKLSIEKSLNHNELRETQQNFLQELENQMAEIVASNEENTFSFSSRNMQGLVETINKFGGIIVSSVPIIKTQILENKLTTNSDFVPQKDIVAIPKELPKCNHEVIINNGNNQKSKETSNNNIDRRTVTAKKDPNSQSSYGKTESQVKDKSNIKEKIDINKIGKEINTSLNNQSSENPINDIIQEQETRNQVQGTEIASESNFLELGESVYSIPYSNDVVYPGVEHGVNASKVYLITFYATITKALYEQTKVITLRIGHRYFGRWKINIMLFKSISTRTVDGEEYHLLRSYLAVPIERFDGNTLIFPYKYCLYVKGKKEHILEYLYLSEFNQTSIIYNRFFELTVGKFNRVKGGRAEVYDLLILPPQGKFSSIVFDEKLKSVPYRGYITFQLCLPYFAGIGQPQVGRCNNIDNFIKSFETLLNRIADTKIVQMNYKESPFKWDSSKHSKIKQQVSAWIKYIMRYNSEVNTISLEENKNNIAKCHIIALLCMKYTVDNKDIICQWLDIIINCLEFASKDNFVGIKVLSNLQGSLSMLKNSYDRMLFDLAYYRYRLTKYLSVIPFYHILFDSQKDFMVCRAMYNYSNSAVLGHPPSCGITIFEYITIEQFISLWERYSAIDPLLVFTFVGSAKLTKKFVKDVSALNNVPFIVYIIVLLFRINVYSSSNHVAYVNAEVRCAIYEEINIKVSLNLTSPLGQVISIPYLQELIAATFMLLSQLPLEDTTDNELMLIMQLFQQQLLLIEKLDNNYFENSVTSGEHFLNSEKLFNLVNKVMCFLYPRHMNLQYANTTKEFELWNHLIILEFPEAYGWKSNLETGLIQRIYSLDFNVLQVLQLRIIDKDGRYDDRLKCIFSENINDCVKHYRGRN